MFFVVLTVLILARFAFLMVNLHSFSEASRAEVFLAFVHGFRFDIATVMLSITLPLLPLWIPAPIRLRRWLTGLSCLLVILIVVAMGIVLTGDVFFFVENSHHVTLEPVDMLGDLLPVTLMLFDGYFLWALLACGLLFGIIWLIYSIFHKAYLIDYLRPGWDWKRLYFLLPVLIITVIGARGGLQNEPLKSADAITGKSTILGNIVLNGWYSFLTEAVKTQRPDHFMDEALATAEVQRLVDPEGDYLSADFPLLRNFSSEAAIVSSEERLNVVLIIVESLNAEYLQSFGGKQSVMPFLDSLSRQGLAFTNFNSISTRSFRGVTAILASYPNLSVDSYRLTFLLPKMRGLGKILGENGYTVRFMHAAPDNSMGIAAICRMSGYEQFVSQEDFPEGQTNGSWGIWDHLALKRMSLEMDAMPEPFHYGIFTLCTHSPWAIPEGFDAPFGNETENKEILNTFAYLDKSLRDFFDYESKRERFGRTLYVILGDHTTHTGEIERFHIGSLFYAPGRFSSRFDDRLADQTDILPTILDACGISTTISAFGRSLLEPPDSVQWSIHYQSNQLNYRRQEMILVSTIVHNLGLYRFDNPDMSGGGLLDNESKIAEEMTFQMKAIYQTSEMMMKQNRIVP